MSIPNILTVIRILLTPVFVIAIIKNAHILALIIFAVAAITDALDGLIARYFNQKTELGAHLDPIADKLLLSSAYVCLAIINHIPNWLTVIVISRDVIIMIGMAICYINNVHVTINPSYASKATTLCQLLTITLALLNEFFNLTTSLTIFCWLTAFLTILSGLHYVFLGMKLLHASGNASSEDKQKDVE
ncbi:CDP-diacylglycerol--glycerol-3-phosphate 3-phosphatidyltransferase [Candidatus Magnetomorum sp. HK-1]|nr:CDP-diacylglycerol--glycerol-3-phosphate 3-phosphatidyltransferase [Candidatus Magnetomorum sp. HK-1]